MDTSPRSVSRKARSSSSPHFLLRGFCVALCAMLSVYCLTSFMAGKAGLVSRSILASRIEAMEFKVAELGGDNARLAAEVKALTSSADRIAREARKIGYLKPDETEILLVGMDSRDGLHPASDGAGIEDVLRVGEIAGFPDVLLKEIALVAGLGVALVFSLIRASATRNLKARKQSTDAESPVSGSSSGVESA